MTRAQLLQTIYNYLDQLTIRQLELLATFLAALTS